MNIVMTRHFGILISWSRGCFDMKLRVVIKCELLYGCHMQTRSIIIIFICLRVTQSLRRRSFCKMIHGFEVHFYSPFHVKHMIWPPCDKLVMSLVTSHVHVHGGPFVYVARLYSACFFVPLFAPLLRNGTTLLVKYSPVFHPSCISYYPVCEIVRIARPAVWNSLPDCLRDPAVDSEQFSGTWRRICSLEARGDSALEVLRNRAL